MTLLAASKAEVKPLVVQFLFQMLFENNAFIHRNEREGDGIPFNHHDQD
jgi:hypothetical protein